MVRTVQVSFDAEHPERLIRFRCEVLGYELEPLHPAERAVEVARLVGLGGVGGGDVRGGSRNGASPIAIAIAETAPQAWPDPDHAAKDLTTATSTTMPTFPILEGRFLDRA